ncbi:MAG: hypothetical protein ACLGSH_11140 [Acidobacteriota bacterium]
MNDLTRYYDRPNMPYSSDRTMVRAYSDWLRPIPWQLFCTFTFPKRVSDQEAVKTFDEFIAELESFYNSDIAYVRGDEKRFSGCGKPASPRHFHALFACDERLSASYITFRWSEKVGERSVGESASIVPYAPQLGGVYYVLKSINQPHGDWAMHKLDHFLPNREPICSNWRARRHLRRRLAREAIIATP